MRADVQAIFKMTPYEKQVMMFTATLSEEVRPICRKFTENPTEVLVDDQKKLTLHGLRQFYVKLGENQKNRQLTDLLDKLEFNQVVIFVSNVKRAKELNRLLIECKFPSMAMYGRMKQDERISRYNKFKKNEERILVSTDIFGRGVDFEKVNIVINYDMPENDDQYLHRVIKHDRLIHSSSKNSAGGTIRTFRYQGAFHLFHRERLRNGYGYPQESTGPIRSESR
mmetsp:Transcript_17821/g.43625  ORF Transcript_17821/g.43625 Transcript_17821/m.43625 type:complete len:225 (+) Transcript_17821:848-1522(+)